MNLEISPAGILAAAGADATELAHCAPFALGSMAVAPAGRELRDAGGTVRTIQPLAMRVLLALAAEHPGTCSREDLISGCWSQRIVGDDAIHRVISTLRRDLAVMSGGTVGIETIPKVGYRLAVTEDGNGADTSHPLPSPRSRASWLRAALLGAVALGLGVAAWAAMTWSPPANAASLKIGVEPVLSDIGDREANRFASGVTADLARLAGAASRIELVDRTFASEQPVDLLIRVTVERDGGAITARSRLVDAGSGSIMLTRDFRDQDGDIARLRDRTAVGLAGVISCGLERSVGAYDTIALRRLYFAACDALESGDTARAESLARELISRRPDVAAGWACLAQIELGKESLSGEEGRATLAAVRGYAKRAIQLDQNSGRGYAALALTWGDSDPRALQTIEKGLRADPEFLNLYAIYATSLFNAGYVKASVVPAQRALALNPASRYYYGLAVRRLLAAARIREAFEVQREAERLFPESAEVIEHRLRLLRYWQDPKEALAEFERTSQDGPAKGSLTQTELRWRVDPQSLNLAELDRMAQADFAQQPSSAWSTAAVMSRLGQVDRALVWLSRAPRREAHNQWSLLFSAETAPLRRDARFFRAMAELGLVDIWLARGKWPDFCSERGLRYSCTQEARRLGYTGTIA